MTVRKNVRHLSDAEKRKFIAAVWALKKEVGADGINTYDRYVRVHMQAMVWPSPPTVNWWERNQPHRGPAFLPWHREFIRQFERDLQRVANDPNVGLPYWDWTQDAANPQGAPIWAGDFLGGNGDPNDNNYVKSGPFRYDPQATERWRTVLADLTLQGVLQGFTQGEGLRRAFSNTLALPSQADVDEVLSITVYDDSDWDTAVQNSFRNVLEGFEGPGLHNIVHGWVGGDMLPGTSPNDPVFFLHHCNVDRIWAQWQAKYPNKPYLPESGGPPGHNLTDPMYPWDGVETTTVVTPEAMLDLGDAEYE